MAAYVYCVKMINDGFLNLYTNYLTIEVAHQVEAVMEAQPEHSDPLHVVSKSEGDLSAASANSRSSDFWK